VGENQPMNVDEIAERLYALPAEEFTRVRNEAERELRKAGEREQADAVKALRKPTAAAGTVNRLVREHRPEVDAFLAAARTLRDAQFAGKGDISAATSGLRGALEKLVSLGGESVRASLQAAAVDDNAARDLLAARLLREPGSAHCSPTPSPGVGSGVLPLQPSPMTARREPNCRRQGRRLQRRKRRSSRRSEAGHRHTVRLRRLRRRSRKHSANSIACTPTSESYRRGDRQATTALRRPLPADPA
jgi:hypothetical protein